MSDELPRGPLLSLLAGHVGEDDKERADLELMRAHARELPRPFDRGQPHAHFTGSAVVVTAAGDQVLLIHHRKLSRWLQPGGHAEPQDAGELASTAVREAQEETGCRVRLHPRAAQALDVDVHQIPSRKDEPAHLHLDVRYLVLAEDPERMKHDPAESHGARWMPFDEALARADEPALRRLLQKARRRVV